MSPGSLRALPAASSVGVSRMMVSSGAPSDPGTPAEVSAASVPTPATAITELAEAGTTHAPSVEIVNTFTLEIK